jgi:NodT family efflux transporter outer membrane factor (OMF) lipoprotein
MKKVIVIPLAAILLASCSFTPDYARPEVQAPSAWQVADSAEQAVVDADWWKNFESEELNRYMAIALADNNDLQAGIYRIEQSRAALKSSGASLMPSASASGSGSKTRTNPAEGKTTTTSSLRGGASVSYELDLFGANRADVEAAEAGLLGAQLDQDALALVTMGDVASQYFTILNLNERLRIADKNLDIARDVLRIVQARFDAGSETALTVSQQKSSLASSEASRVSLAEQLATAQNAFSILLARNPGDVKVENDTLIGLTVPDIAAGQPSSLLERRPDLKSAEADLIAANANIGAAKAAFFPSVSLGLDWSIASAGFGDPVSIATSLASALSAPLFQGGRLEAGVEQATARQKELAENYQQTVLVAFREVEDALISVKAAQERELSLRTAMTEAQRSYDLTKDLYDAGSIDFRTLLDVQRTLLSAEDSYTQERLTRLNSAITLYLALGGGWAQSG